ncbi:MAG: hydroxyacid dehydrogenase, partial [Clostridium sp.]
NAKNAVVTPHVAFATKEALEKRAVIVFENITRWLER